MFFFEKIFPSQNVQGDQWIARTGISRRKEHLFANFIRMWCGQRQSKLTTRFVSSFSTRLDSKKEPAVSSSEHFYVNVRTFPLQCDVFGEELQHEALVEYL